MTEIGLNFAQRRSRAPVSAKHAPTKADKDQPDQRQGQTDRCKVEHPEQLAETVLANLIDDDIG